MENVVELDEKGLKALQEEFKAEDAKAKIENGKENFLAVKSFKRTDDFWQLSIEKNDGFSNTYKVDKMLSQVKDSFTDLNILLSNFFAKELYLVGYQIKQKNEANFIQFEFTSDFNEIECTTKTNPIQFKEEYLQNLGGAIYAKYLTLNNIYFKVLEIESCLLENIDFISGFYTKSTQLGLF